MSDPRLVSVETEAALLGALMLNPKLVDGVTDSLRPDHFSEPVHARIFDTIGREHSKGHSVSPVALRPFFEGDPLFDGIGGPGYLAQLTGSGAVVIGAGDFARQVKELAQRRELVASLQSSIDAASDYDTPLSDAVEAADAALAKVNDEDAETGEFTGCEALDLVINGFDEEVKGVLCGIIPAIDALLGPMRPSHMVVGAGRPGMGKTASALSYALGAAERGHGVLFVSLEMAAEQLAERMAADLCLDARIPYADIRDRRLSSRQRMDVCRARDRLASMPLQILDKQGLSISQLRTIVRRWARRFEARGQRLELVVVDYLQLLRAERRMDRFEAVTEISRSLKEMAKEMGLAVFALSQLSRETEKRGDKRPQLSDLRESGQIEQDADAVLFFLRHEYYLRQAEPPPNDAARAEWEGALAKCEGSIEFICAKRRNGQAGSRTGQFLGQFQAVRG